MKTHDEFWDVAHQIVKPVVDTGQNVDWLIAVPENKKNRVSYKRLTYLKMSKYLRQSKNKQKPQT